MEASEDYWLRIVVAGGQVAQYLGNVMMDPRSTIPGFAGKQVGVDANGRSSFCRCWW
jgi:formylmethanofuran dehydrogenase subunit C